MLASIAAEMRGALGSARSRAASLTIANATRIATAVAATNAINPRRRFTGTLCHTPRHRWGTSSASGRRTTTGTHLPCSAPGRASTCRPPRSRRSRSRRSCRCWCTPRSSRGRRQTCPTHCWWSSPCSGPRRSRCTGRCWCTTPGSRRRTPTRRSPRWCSPTSNGRSTPHGTPLRCCSCIRRPRTRSCHRHMPAPREGWTSCSRSTRSAHRTPALAPCGEVFHIAFLRSQFIAASGSAATAANIPPIAAPTTPTELTSEPPKNSPGTGERGFRPALAKRSGVGSMP